LLKGAGLPAETRPTGKGCWSAAEQWVVPGGKDTERHPDLLTARNFCTDRRDGPDIGGKERAKQTTILGAQHLRSFGLLAAILQIQSGKSVSVEVRQLS
jgi:hypothetical protein